MRKAFLLFSTLIMSLGSACAPDHGSDEDVNPGLAVADDEMELDPVKLQAPPIKMRLEVNQEGPILAMVALRSSVGSYAGGMEHWFGSPVRGLSSLASFVETTTLVVTPLSGETESSITEWAAPLSLAFSSPRDVSQRDWTDNVIRGAETGKTLLFVTPHPDDSREYLGVVVSTNDPGALQFTGWYRSSPPETTGRAFNSTSFSQRLTLVVDADGKPSTDPTWVREGTWYSIMMTP